MEIITRRDLLVTSGVAAGAATGLLSAGAGESEAGRKLKNGGRRKRENEEKHENEKAVPCTAKVTALTAAAHITRPTEKSENA